jgi:predicted dehydrogenase/nucleoside-diphosphate-sugar epimerase
MSPEMRKLKVGFVGAGYISDAHARAVQVNPLSQAHAIFDPSRSRAEIAARTHGIPHVCASLDELLQTDLDVVHVLSPPDSHFETARKVIEARRHVFIEKPMALTAVHCQELVSLAAERGMALGVNHNFLFLKSYEQLRAKIRNGDVGRLDQVTINWLFGLGLIKFGPFNSWMLRDPRNLFLEIGSHLCAFAIDLIGEPTDFQVRTSRPLQIPGGATVYRRWHVYAQAGDTALDINLSLSPGIEDRSLTIRGYAASARVDYSRDVITLDQSTGAGAHFGDFAGTERQAWQYAKTGFGNLARSLRGKVRKTPDANPFTGSIARSIDAFYRSIGGAPDTRVNGTFATSVIRMCEAVTETLPVKAGSRGDLVTGHVTAPAASPTVLVVGGTGFIGKLLVRKLVERGISVRVTTRSRRSAEAALEGMAVDIVEGNLSDSGFMVKALQGIEVVYHLAKVDAKKWVDYYEQDVLVTRQMGELALKAGVKRFIYTGTIDSYYSAQATETITSETPLDQRILDRNLYARSKAACEQELLKLHRSEGLPVVILRPGIVIGSGCPPAHWGVGLFESDTHVKYWGTGENLLPLVLVDDVAEALVLAMQAEDVIGQIFLVTDKPMLSARDYVEVVSREMRVRIQAQPTPIWRHFVNDCVKESVKNLVKHPNRRKPSYRDWDSRSHRAVYDSTRTQQVLGWRPVADRQLLIDRGIVEPVREFMF